MNNPLENLPQHEWDAFINSILKPFLSFAYKDALVSRSDLQQEAWIAMLSACEKYDPTRRVRFTTFAYKTIRGHLLRYVAKCTKEKLHQQEYDERTDYRGITNHVVENSNLMNTLIETVKDSPHVHLLTEYFVHNKSYRTIAKKEGVSHETIGTRIGALLETLQKRLNNENY